MVDFTKQKRRRTALFLLFVISLGVSVVHAQQEYPVSIKETLPDGTETYRMEMCSVTESEVKRVANATDSNDDLQLFIDNAASMTRASSDTIVVDLSNFSATTRNNTLAVSTGKIYKFCNGTIKRGSSLGTNPIIDISKNSTVILESTATVSGENLKAATGVRIGSSKFCLYGSIVNLQEGSENLYGYGIYENNTSTIEIYGNSASVYISSVDCNIKVGNNGLIKSIAVR